MGRTGTIIASVLLAAVAQAQAQYTNPHSDRVGQWYVGGSAAVVFTQDATVSNVDGFGIPIGNDLSFDTGWGAAGNVGTYVGGPIRVEAEVLYRRNGLDDFSVDGFGSVGVGGRVEQVGIMGNLLFDFAVTDRTDIYAGGGIGAAYVRGRLNDITVPGVGTFGGSGSDWVFAWQVLVGAAHEIADGVHLTGGYRLFGTADPRIAGVRFEAPLTHSIELGVRFTF